MRLGVFPEVRTIGDPVDGDGYPKSRMPDSPPEMFHLFCPNCKKVWWDAEPFRDNCPFCDYIFKKE